MITTKECYDLIWMAIPEHLREDCTVHIISEERCSRWLERKSPDCNKHYEILVYHWLPSRFSRTICTTIGETDLASCYHDALKQLEALNDTREN